MPLSDLNKAVKRPDTEGGIPLEGKNYLLVIGINNYENYPQLRNAVSDAKNFERVLTQRYGFLPNNTVALYDEQATDIAIKRALGKFRQLSAEDKLIIYYSGHGFFEKPVGSIVPVNAPADTDAGFIPNSTFIDYFKMIPAKHILLILDSCFGGSFATTKDVEIDKVVERVEQKASRKFMSSGSIEEVSDGIVGTNSPFSKALVRCLEENTKPKAIVSDLFQEIRKKTAFESLQLPQYETLVGVGHDGGEMVLYLNTPSVLEQKTEKNNTPEQGFSVSSQKENISQSSLFYQQGIKKFNDLKFGEALVLFNRAIQLDDLFAEAYYKRASAKAQLKDYDNALNDFNKAIKINPQYVAAYHDRGNLKEHFLNDYKDAISDYNSAIKLDPNYALSYYSRGRIKNLHFKEYREALLDYDTAITLDPQVADAYFYYERGCLKLNQFDDLQGALQDFNEAVILKADYTEAYYERASVRKALNDLKGALEDYDKTLELEPNHIKAKYFRGFIKGKTWGDGLFK
jgi:tetratricopeptide (TPR) repeat protein